MPNLQQTIASGLAQLKNYYQGPLVSQFTDETPIYSGASIGKHPWSGLQVVRGLKVRRNQGIGATNDGGPLPNTGKQSTIQVIIGAKYNYLRFAITGPMIKASQNDVGSFVRSAAYELKEGYVDLQQDVNRQLSWDGTGTLAQVNTAAVGATSLVIKGREAVEAALKFIDVDLVVDITDGINVLQSGVTVTGITTGDALSLTATITVSPAVTAAVGNTLVRANSFGNEVQGLLTQLDGGTSTVFNIPRANYIATQGNAIDFGGAQLQLDSLKRLWNECLRRGAGKIKAIYSDFDSERMYEKLLAPEKRFNNTVKGDGGFSDKEQSYLEYNGVPWVADKDCPQRIFMLPDNVVTKYILAEMEIADETGSTYIAVTGVDTLESRMRFFFNLFNEKASGSGVAKNYISP